MSNSSTVFMGLDPGYDRIGWAIGSWHKTHWQELDYGCIITDPKQPIFERFKQIQTDLGEILTEFHPSIVGIETLFFSSNKTTALRVSEARGVILAELLRSGVEIRELNPNQIKLAVTGNGHADKTAVAKMVRLGLQLGEQPIIDDAMDALAALLTCQTTYVVTSNRSTPSP